MSSVTITLACWCNFEYFQFESLLAFTLQHKLRVYCQILYLALSSTHKHCVYITQIYLKRQFCDAYVETTMFEPNVDSCDWVVDWV